MDTAFLSATKLIRALEAKKLGALELLDYYAARIKKYDGVLNSLPVLDMDAARRRAKALDRKGAKAGPLAGLPMTVKESFDFAGYPTTWGLAEYANVPAKTNAVAVQRLFDAGANVFGKSNVPTLLADWETVNVVYGKTVSPWDHKRTPGGSSGGAAAALAAGLTGLEVGSDIGGSIRNPAHFCGIYGHKSTWGVCSMAGSALPGAVHPTDISVIGPMGRSAADLELGLSIIAGPDVIDARGWKAGLPKCTRKTLDGWRVAVIANHPTAEVDSTVEHSIRRLAQFLSSKGAKVSERALPDFDFGEAHRVFIQLLRGATSGRQTPEQFANMLAAKERLDPKDQGYHAQMVRANTQPHRDWLIASNRRHQMRLAWAEFFKDWDVLLCPNGATAAYPHSMPGERWERTVTVNGKPQPLTTQMWWAGISGMCYLPGTAAPIGLSPDGLPLSVQIVGPQYADLHTIRFAQLLERDYYAFAPPPAYA